MKNGERQSTTKGTKKDGNGREPRNTQKHERGEAVFVTFVYFVVMDSSGFRVRGFRGGDYFLRSCCRIRTIFIQRRFVITGKEGVFMRRILITLAMVCLFTSSGCFTLVYRENYVRKGEAYSEYGLLGLPVRSDDPPIHGLLPLYRSKVESDR